MLFLLRRTCIRSQRIYTKYKRTRPLTFFSFFSLVFSLSVFFFKKFKGLDPRSRDLRAADVIIIRAIAQAKRPNYTKYMKNLKIAFTPLQRVITQIYKILYNEVQIYLLFSSMKGRFLLLNSI